MSIISEIQQKADFQATIKAFIALFMDFNRPWQAGHKHQREDQNKSETNTGPTPFRYY